MLCQPGCSFPPLCLLSPLCTPGWCSSHWEVSDMPSAKCFVNANYKHCHYCWTSFCFSEYGQETEGAEVVSKQKNPASSKHLPPSSTSLSTLADTEALPASPCEGVSRPQRRKTTQNLNIFGSGNCGKQLASVQCWNREHRAVAGGRRRKKERRGLQRRQNQRGSCGHLSLLSTAPVGTERS